MRDWKVGTAPRARTARIRTRQLARLAAGRPVPPAAVPTQALPPASARTPLPLAASADTAIATTRSRFPAVLRGRLGRLPLYALAMNAFRQPFVPCSRHRVRTPTPLAAADTPPSVSCPPSHFRNGTR